MTCAFATWDGAYVLGSLSPAEREEYEQHLDGCAACAASVRDLAGLPGLLSRVDERSLTLPDEPAPATLLPRLVREVRRERRRHARVTTGLAAAAVVTVVAGTVTVGALTSSDPVGVAQPPTVSPSAGTTPNAGPDATPGDATPGAEARAMEPVDGTAVEGWLTVETVPWGTRLTLQCTYPPSLDGYGGGGTPGYVMVVRTRDGGEREVATWNAVPGRAVQLTAATAAARDDIASVEVRTDTGRPVLRLSG